MPGLDWAIKPVSSCGEIVNKVKTAQEPECVDT